ncbi:MAG: DUF554 domain-containing protein [Eubacteriales bacterium]
MVGIGTLVNVGAIILGGVIGLFVKNGLPEKVKRTIMQALGLSVIFIGVMGVLDASEKIISLDGFDPIMTMILCLIIGGVIGELIDVEDKLDKLGKYIQSKVGNTGDFVKGFVTASLIFCIGAMAIVGALEDGLLQNPQKLYAKAILDGVAAIVFTTTLGIGVIFSIIPVFIYQGGITLLSSLIEPVLTDVVIFQMSLVGNVLIFAIGINILEITKIKIGNLLPAIFIPLIIGIIKLFII